MVTTEVLDINISEVIALGLVVVEGCMTFLVGLTGRAAMHMCGKKRIVNKYSLVYRARHNIY